MSSPGTQTIGDLLDGALDAYAVLAELAGESEDEWSYVDTLTRSWSEQIEVVASARGHEAADPELADAVDAASREIGQIRDRYRALDWLSTYPQVILLALGELA